MSKDSHQSTTGDFPSMENDDAIFNEILCLEYSYFTKMPWSNSLPEPSKQ